MRRWPAVSGWNASHELTSPEGAGGVLDRAVATALGPHGVGVGDVVEGGVEVGIDLDVHRQPQPNRSMTVALAWPPPSHIVWNP